MVTIQQVPSRSLSSPSLPAASCSPCPYSGLAHTLGCSFSASSTGCFDSFACQRCSSSRRNTGDDSQAADPAWGQEQARTLAGAGMLPGLPRGGQEDALEPSSPKQ